MCLFFPLAFVALCCCCCCCCLLRVFRSSLAALCSFGSLVISFTRALACNHWLFIHKVTHKDNKELAFFVRVCVSVLPCFMLCSSACSLHVFFLSFFLSFFLLLARSAVPAIHSLLLLPLAHVRACCPFGFLSFKLTFTLACNVSTCHVSAGWPRRSEQLHQRSVHSPSRTHDWGSTRLFQRRGGALHVLSAIV